MGRRSIGANVGFSVHLTKALDVRLRKYSAKHKLSRAAALRQILDNCI
jgi:hypothetical protein